MRMIRLIFVLSFLAFACRENTSNSKRGATGSSDMQADGLVTAEELMPGENLKSLDELELRTEINDEDDFYANKPQKPQQPSNDAEVDKCIKETFGEIKIESTNNKLVIRASVDMGECITKSPSINIRLPIKIYYSFTCSDADLSKYNGMTLNDLSNGDRDEEIEDISISCGASDYTHISKSEIFIESATKLGDKEFKLESHRKIYSVNSRADGAPCHKEKKGDQIVHDDGCFNFKRSINIVEKVNGESSRKEGEESYTKLEYEGIKEGEKDKPPYFSEGKIKVQFNDWHGEVLYTAPDKAPTWTISSGDTTLSGTFGDPPGAKEARLTQSMESALQDKINRVLHSVLTDI